MDISGLKKIRKDFTNAFSLPIEPCGNNCHFNINSSLFSPYCKKIFSNSYGYHKCVEMRQKALETALGTGRENIFLCHAGLICCALPVIQDNKNAGCLFMGKVRIRAGEEKTVDFPEISKELPSNYEKLEHAWHKTIMVTPEEFQEAADLFVTLTNKYFNHESHGLREKFITSNQQSKIAEIIHHQKKSLVQHGYPYIMERDLAKKIASGDRVDAIKGLNEILGNILFKDIGNLPLIKARIMELIIILSRAVSNIEGSQDDVFSINREYTEKISRSENLEEICLLVAQIMEKFLNLSQTIQTKTRNRSFQMAINYIQNNLNEKLTLKSVARQAGIGPFRLAHLFREILNTTYVEYLNSFRVEAARKLLATSDLSATEIAYKVGFSDQSYFTKIFKKMAGITPKKFQMENRRLQRYFLIS
ncbi:MAG: PocR ligand-binding domain-containing protein [bacterium]